MTLGIIVVFSHQQHEEFHPLAPKFIVNNFYKPFYITTQEIAQRCQIGGFE